MRSLFIYSTFLLVLLTPVFLKAQSDSVDRFHFEFHAGYSYPTGTMKSGIKGDLLSYAEKGECFGITAGYTIKTKWKIYFSISGHTYGIQRLNLIEEFRENIDFENFYVTESDRSTGFYENVLTTVGITKTLTFKRLQLEPLIQIGIASSRLQYGISYYMKEAGSNYDRHVTYSTNETAKPFRSFAIDPSIKANFVLLYLGGGRVGITFNGGCYSNTMGVTVTENISDFFGNSSETKVKKQSKRVFLPYHNYGLFLKF